jgi:hypothetical protein
MQPLPFSLQSFPRLRQLGCLYVDKTKFAHDLIIQEQSFLLSRPRRFGKSLFLSTLREILLGHKELFSGCWIEKSAYTWPVYGVIHLDFAPIDNSNAGSVKNSLCRLCLDIAQDYQIPLSSDFTDPNATFIALTRALHAKYKKVAVLIDEYDHPILNSLQEPHVEEIRNILQSFFTTIKSLSDSIYFLFITGVSMFSKAGIFSGMNHPENISFDPEFAGICGYTEAEMKLYFTPYLSLWAEQENISLQELEERLRHWYNGYRFSETSLSVYNPFSVLQAIKKKTCKNFWFETGSPSFLIKELQKRAQNQEEKLFDLENFKVSTGLLSSVDLDRIPISGLLFQTGYLTLSRYDPKSQNYWLDFPNHEVKAALNQHLLTLAAKISPESADYISKELSVLLDQENVQEAIACLKTLMSSVPYQLHIEKEQFYHGLLQIACHASGIQSHSEYSTSHGRIDLVLDLPSRCYVCEIKFNEEPELALKQIEDRKYYERFLSGKKPIILLGISFWKRPKDFQITYVQKNLSQ